MLTELFQEEQLFSSCVYSQAGNTGQFFIFNFYFKAENSLQKTDEFITVWSEMWAESKQQNHAQH